MSKESNSWDLYSKGVKPLKASPKKNITKKATAATNQAKKAATTHTVEALLKATAPKLKHNWSNPLDKKMERAMRSGEVALDARLDLHGMTQKEAHEALQKFLTKAVKTEKRILLLIPGRGGVLKGGVLKSNLRSWLENFEEAPHILRFTQAALSHGGSGAFYLVLKNPRRA